MRSPSREASALGSYQAGVYETLGEHGYPPDVVNGISIGAVNCAIIAGHAPEDRVARLCSILENLRFTKEYPLSLKF